MVAIAALCHRLRAFVTHAAAREQATLQRLNRPLRLITPHSSEVDRADQENDRPIQGKASTEPNR